MNFRSVRDLNDTVLRRLPDLPADIDVVVGVPRSGMLAATLIALHRNLPLADLEGFVQGRILGGGQRLERRLGMPDVRDAAAFRRPLVVDDSLATGGSMQAARRRLAAERPGLDPVFAAVYVRAGFAGHVDFAFEQIAGERMFEWNCMHHPLLLYACMDIDGVLCADPTAAQNDDGPRYLEFLGTAAPLRLPTVRVGWLVTCRLEKYRAATERWLREHEVAYNHLVMLDLPSKEARLASAGHAAFKARVYRETGARLFVESDAVQAGGIARFSGRPVLCVGGMHMVYPPGAARLPAAVGALPGRVAASAKRWLKRHVLQFDPPHRRAA